MKVARLGVANELEECRLEMNKQCDEYVIKVGDLAKRMSVLADQMDAECDDDGCAVISGVIRDCAYKIRNRVEQRTVKRGRDGHE